MIHLKPKEASGIHRTKRMCLVLIENPSDYHDNGPGTGSRLIPLTDRNQQLNRHDVM